MRSYNGKISKNVKLRMREAVVHRQRTMLVVVIILLLTMGIFLSTSVNALASSKTDSLSYYKYYTSIRIESGDTLWNIANDYIDTSHISKSEYIREVCQINGISKDDLQAGDYIIVPYYSEEYK